jgi:hypothetical protein
VEVCYDADGLSRSSALAAIDGVGTSRSLVDRFWDAVESTSTPLCDTDGQVLVCG